jgi:hypothetical protein
MSSMTSVADFSVTFAIRSTVGAATQDAASSTSRTVSSSPSMCRCTTSTRVAGRVGSPASVCSEIARASSSA